MYVYSQYGFSKKRMQEMTPAEIDFYLRSLRKRLDKQAAKVLPDEIVELRFDWDDIFGSYLIRMRAEVD